MKITVSRNPGYAGNEAIVLPVFKGKGLSQLYGQFPGLEPVAKRLRFKAAGGESVVFYSPAEGLVIAVGAGSGHSGSVPDTVKCAKKIISLLIQHKVKHGMIRFYQQLEIPTGFWLNFIDFLHMSHYRFDSYSTGERDTRLEKLNVWFSDAGTGKNLTPSLVKERLLVAKCVNDVRDMVNEPASVMTPDAMLEQFQQLATGNDVLKVTVYRGNQLAEEGLNGTLTVGLASQYEPAMVTVAYEPPEAVKRVALVGKGVTFDAGGMNIKTGSYMYDMKTDMSGAAAVFGVMKFIGEMGLPIAVKAFVPIAENMVDNRAFKPGDVIKFKNKKTVEVVNTDAEGRLMLADALLLAAEWKPVYIVELSTLTGNIVRALGESVAGVMGNHKRLAGLLAKAGRNCGERLWQLPLIDDYRETIKSKIADLKNAGYGVAAGAIKAGLFLEHFVEGVPFAHIDIGGTAHMSKPSKFYAREGATGFGVRLLLEFLKMLVRPAYEKK